MGSGSNSSNLGLGLCWVDAMVVKMGLLPSERWWKLDCSWSVLDLIVMVVDDNKGVVVTKLESLGLILEIAEGKEGWG